MSRLHTTVLGTGVPAIFVHGSFGWGTDTFPEQGSLADDYQVVLVDRRGFGDSTFADAEGWPADMHDLAELLEEIGPAHLVGQSYGAVVALLAAGLQPDRVLSLIAIEPPAFEVAAADTAADKTTVALKPVFERAKTLTAEEFITAWALAQGRTREQLDAWIGSFGERDWAAVEASRHERWPGDAPFQFQVLRATRFPKLLVRGAWKPEVVGRDDAGKDFAAVCDRIAHQIGARVVVFEQSTHNPQLQDQRRPDRLRARRAGPRDEAGQTGRDGLAPDLGRPASHVGACRAQRRSAARTASGAKPPTARPTAELETKNSPFANTP